MSDHAVRGADPPEVLRRRQFLSRISLAASGLAGAVVSVPILAYLLSPLIRPARQIWQNLGPVDRFRVGETVEVAFDDPSPLPWAGRTAKTAVWLRRNGADSFTAFAVNCTHLGCPVSWLPDAKIFLCPCHGGVYYSDGRVAGGPPPRPLFQYDTRVEGGQVQLLTHPLPISG